MANNFLPIIDRPIWTQTAPHPNAHGAGMCLAFDLRRDASRHRHVYGVASNATMHRYSTATKAWQTLFVTPFAAGTFGVGTGMVFAPSLGAVGTIAAGATTTTFTLSTALSAAVGVNQLANNGGYGTQGYRIRIIDTVAGKTEERLIIGNTAGTTPTIRVNAAFTFTPATGARYELLCGRVIGLNGGTTGAGTFRAYDPATGAITSLGTTNLPTTVGTDSNLVVLDEAYVPFDCVPGEGMIKGSTVYDTDIETRNALLATGSGASTLTGQATGGDAAVLANEYRNYQIRIVADPTTPTSVGQRRIIASHTAAPGAPVYTLGTAWTVQPSSSARFVIEQPNLLIARTTAVVTVYTYNYGDATINNGTNSIAANAWSTTYVGNAPAGFAAGIVAAPSFGIRPDADKNARHSFIYYFRGGATNTLDLLDIAGSATGTWTGAIAYEGQGPTFTTGASGAYAPWNNEGRYLYLQLYVASNPNTLFRFDVQNRSLVPFAAPDNVSSGTASIGQRFASYPLIDKDGVIYPALMLHNVALTTVNETYILV